MQFARQARPLEVVKMTFISRLSLIKVDDWSFSFVSVSPLFPEISFAVTGVIIRLVAATEIMETMRDFFLCFIILFMHFIE